MKKQILGALLCAGLLLGLILPASGSAPVYLMAVNDTVMEMTAGNMPIITGGTLYVPYTMFSRQDSGISLGVSAQYNATMRTVLVSSRRRAVTFDVRANTAYDLQGEAVEGRAIERNSLVYLPIAWICEYFETVNYSTSRTPYGILVRVTNSGVILSDAEFIDAADSQLRDNLERYQDSLASAGTGSEAPEPSASLSVGDGPLVYLGLRHGARTEESAQLLESHGERALFLFAPEELIQADDLIRRVAAQGHTVGLALTGTNGDECLRQAEEGARLLAHIARYPVLILSAPELDDQGAQMVEQAGYVLWEANVRGAGAASAAGLLRQLSGSRANYLALSCGEEGYALLSRAMRSLTGSGYRLRQVTAAQLSMK